MKRLLIAVAGLSLVTGLTFAQMRDVPPWHWALQSDPLRRRAAFWRLGWRVGLPPGSGGVGTG